MQLTASENAIDMRGKEMVLINREGESFFIYTYTIYIHANSFLFIFIILYIFALNK